MSELRVAFVERAPHAETRRDQRMLALYRVDTRTDSQYSGQTITGKFMEQFYKLTVVHAKRVFGVFGIEPSASAAYS